MKPPFSYYGGKMGMAARIVELLPPHRVYLEPYFGSGAVLFAKSEAAIEVVNDVDGNLVTFFRVLRERPDELARVCELTPYARAELTAAHEPTTDELERARRWWVRVSQSFGKSGNATTGWSVTTARSQSPAATAKSLIARFDACSRRLARVCIEQGDGALMVERLATPDSVVYVDPPYLAETRRGNDRRRPEDYSHDMGGEADHRRLAEVLTACPATVVLSGYPSPLYDELYDGWHRLDTPVMVKASNARTSDRQARTEVLWCNRPLSLGLFGR